MTARALLALPLFALTLASCGDKPGFAQVNFRHNKDGKGTKVASFGGDFIAAEELKQRFAEMSQYARARYQTVEQRKEFVEGMVRFELLAQEAVRRGMANDPEVVEQAKRVMVQQLLRKELEEKPTPVPEAEVSRYYEKHRADYVKPEMVRLAHVFLTDKDKAAQVLEKAKALQPMDYQGFAQLVREHSEEARTKPLEGDMRFLSLEELSSQYGPEVAQAAQKLTQVGQLAEEPVQTSKGFHVLKLQGRQAALNLSLEQVRTQVQQILLHERKMQNYQALLDSLKKSQGYQVDEQALSRIEVDLKAPAVEAKGPQVGFVPAPNQAAVAQ
ncbi:MAG: peptidyl-prolyl cis-trans isomerase [Myxococcales bacterium]|nr:peptidyl-prolyl cis-trans isomerase [Myxococcales bacterium]